MKLPRDLKGFDLAKAMGDQEATVKRYYIETLEPNVGHKWFKVKL